MRILLPHRGTKRGGFFSFLKMGENPLLLPEYHVSIAQGWGKAGGVLIGIIKGNGLLGIVKTEESPPHLHPRGARSRDVLWWKIHRRSLALGGSLDVLKIWERPSLS